MKLKLALVLAIVVALVALTVSTALAVELPTGACENIAEQARAAIQAAGAPVTCP